MEISIAMATYNGAKYIREQLDSILKQSVQDFELIIGDDCSTDDTWSIIQEYARQYTNIRAFHNKNNIGYRRNFENLVNLCQGEYIAFCDQDDIWKENHLKVLYENMGNKAICTANAMIIDERGIYKGFKLSDFLGLKKIPTNDLDKAYICFYYLNPFPGCNMMLRKSFLQKALPIKDNRIKLHDSFACALACVSGMGINYVDEITMLYRFHKDSVTSDSKNRFLSPYRCMIRKLISPTNSPHNYVKDQIYYCAEIMDRNIDLSLKQKQFLRQAFKYHSRRDTLPGRFLNFIFDLLHFRKIYMRKISN